LLPQVRDRCQLAGYRNAKPMTLKPAVAGARSFAAVAGRALVTLAQPAASATRAVIAASVVASDRDAVMTMRRIPDQSGSGARARRNQGRKRARPACLAALVMRVHLL
jgi:hypothetical protein